MKVNHRCDGGVPDGVGGWGIQDRASSIQHPASDGSGGSDFALGDKHTGRGAFARDPPTAPRVAESSADSGGLGKVENLDSGRSTLLEDDHAGPFATGRPVPATDLWLGCAVWVHVDPPVRLPYV
jgi:hypothetical protein